MTTKFQLTQNKKKNKNNTTGITQRGFLLLGNQNNKIRHEINKEI